MKLEKPEKKEYVKLLVGKLGFFILSLLIRNKSTFIKLTGTLSKEIKWMSF